MAARRRTETQCKLTLTVDISPELVGNLDTPTAHMILRERFKMVGVQKLRTLFHPWVPSMLGAEHSRGLVDAQPLWSAVFLTPACTVGSQLAEAESHVRNVNSTSVGPVGCTLPMALALLKGLEQASVGCSPRRRVGIWNAAALCGEAQVLDCSHSLAPRAAHRYLSLECFSASRVQAALDARAQWTEPLTQLAAVIKQCTPAPGERESCSGTSEVLASQVCTPERETTGSWRDGDPSM